MTSYSMTLSYSLARDLSTQQVDVSTLVTSKVKLPGCRRGRLLIQRGFHDPLTEAGIGDHSIAKPRPEKL